MKIETILSPAELPMLARHDLSHAACVVFDILRATSTFVTALQNGAQAIIPVREIPEAMALRQQQPDILLAGERDGMKIRAAQSGGLDFDFGNSPREFIPEKITGRIIASTTTNGTRALRACAGAKSVLAASFLNLTATADFLQQNRFPIVLLVCAGTGEGVALEDVLAAGALIKCLRTTENISPECSDATETAYRTYLSVEADLPTAFRRSQNARRLLAIPELQADVAFCLQRDIHVVVAGLDGQGALRKLRG